MESIRQQAAAAGSTEDLKRKIAELAERGQALSTELAPPASSGCEECEGGWIYRMDSAGARRAERCACRVPQFAPSVPMEFRKARIANYDELAGNEVALGAASELLAALPRGGRDLYLFGGIGAGKTRLACSILNEAFLQHRIGSFSRVPRLLLDLQRIWSGQLEERAEASALIEQMYTDPLLVLDDVAGENGSDYTRRTLLTIYEARCDLGVRTIWTSNLNLKDLKNFLGDDRLPSRLAGRAEIVQLACRDQRIERRGR